MSASSHNFPAFSSASRWASLILFLCVLVVVYFFFADWQTRTIYGDDLYVFKTHSEATDLSTKWNQPLIYGKYRPVHGLGIHLLIEMFQKNLSGYYLFNVLIQSINVILLAASVHLFIKNVFLSVLLSLVTGLSAFALFNMTQLFNGGALEGLAMTFFLSALYFIVKVLYVHESSVRIKTRDIIWAIIFANLAMYTHERYIVLLPFIFLLLCIAPSLRKLRLNKRIALLACTVLGIIVNVAIKKYMYGMPFLMGTASTTIQFSYATALTFLGDAMLSLIRWNAGPEYLIGTKFATLSFFNRTMIVIIGAVFLLLLSRYIIRSLKGRPADEKLMQHPVVNFIFLIVLGGMVLLPAVSTIRLEQRWLQAPFALFVLLFSIVLSDFIRNKPEVVKIGAVLIISLTYIKTDFNYLKFGRDNFYLVQSEAVAGAFKKAIDNNIIRPDAEKLFIWQKQRDDNIINSVGWTIGGGYLFDFYQGKSKVVSFTDSVYEKSKSTADTVSFNFRPGRDQLLYITPDHNLDIFDITNSYIADSLRDFRPETLASNPNSRVVYNKSYLKITNTDTEKFVISGLHGDENGSSWTNGDVSLGFRGDFLAKDSLFIILNTYMPPACKNIIPGLLIKDKSQVEVKPLLMQRNGDSFKYTFRFDKPTFVKEIRIQSDTIQATPPDTRRLSFPFINLEIKDKQ